ncbi:MAG TPA: hypothetical protein EYP58_02040 [bacterium (Candidatus Stahlbacteria)]|nr:hypothetical protein [Candidatus Stahlbacteria bacterium]
MSKLLTAIVIFSMFGSAYAISFGAGGEYRNLLVDGVDANPGIVADVYFKMLPFLGARFGIADIDMPEGSTNYTVGVHTGADLMFFIPLQGAPIDPYLLLGFTYTGNGATVIDLTGGAGVDFFFNPQFGLYLEGAINYKDIEDVDSSNPLYIGGGLKVKVPMP